MEADARDNDVKEKWPFAMKLPCRHCEKEFAISKFTSATDFKTIWAATIAKGQNLACPSCRRILGHVLTEAIIACDVCERLRLKRLFTSDMQSYWAQMRQDKTYCLHYLHEGEGW